MENDHENKYCLVTITSSGYLAGTIVMLHTFLKYNPWFSGDILIYEHQLSDFEKDILTEFPNVLFPKPDPDLLERIDLVTSVHAKLAHKKMVFYSLNIFSLQGYDKYMYIDADAFFTGSIKDIVDSRYNIMFSPDRSTYIQAAKDSVTYKTEKNPDDSSRYWYNTFNAGIFFADKTVIRKDIYRELVAHVHPDTYLTLLRPTTDQYILNKHFRNNYVKLPTIYNYRLNLTKLLREKENATMGKARIIHFNGGKNPWNASNAVKSLKKFRAYRYAFLLWYGEYLEYMQSIHCSAFPNSSASAAVLKFQNDDSNDIATQSRKV